MWCKFGHVTPLKPAPTKLAWPTEWVRAFRPRCAGGGSEAGSYLRLTDPCITQLKAQGPSRTCNASKEDDKSEDLGHGGEVGDEEGVVVAPLSGGATRQD